MPADWPRSSSGFPTAGCGPTPWGTGAHRRLSVRVHCTTSMSAAGIRHGRSQQSRKCTRQSCLCTEPSSVQTMRPTHTWQGVPDKFAHAASTLCMPKHTHRPRHRHRYMPCTKASSKQGCTGLIHSKRAASFRHATTVGCAPSRQGPTRS